MPWRCFSWLRSLAVSAGCWLRSLAVSAGCWLRSLVVSVGCAAWPFLLGIFPLRNGEKKRSERSEREECRFERGFDPNESSSSRTLPTLVVAPRLPSTPPSPSSLSPSCPGVGRRRAVPPLPSLSSLLSPSSPSSSSSLATAVWLHEGVHVRLQLCVWGCAPPAKPTCGHDPWRLSQLPARVQRHRRRRRRLSQLPALLRPLWTRGASSRHCSTTTADWSSRSTA